MDGNLTGSILAAIIAFFAAIIAAGITLLGVWLQNRHARKCLLEQLAIESKERKHERELALRKEVYLQAVDDMTRAMQLLGEFTNDNLGKININNFIEGFASSVGKINIVGTDETVHTVAELNKQYYVTFFKLYELAIPLMKLNIDKNILQQEYDEYDSERSEVVQQMKNLNMRNESNPQKWDKLKKDFDEADAEAERISNELAMKNKECFKRQQELIFVIMEECAKLSLLLGHVVVSIRRELGLHFDETRFLESFNQGKREVEIALKGFFKKLDSLNDNL